VIEDEEYRKAIRSFTTGVTIVTIPTSGGMHGMTASSFASVSVVPQLVSINVAKVARAHAYMMDAATFGINLLLETQHDLANFFARRGSPDAGFASRLVAGTPILGESLGYFVCRKWACYDGGDHTIVVGEVLAIERTDARPLVCSRGRFHALGTQLTGIPPAAALITTT
jgi:flavin reductase (DIM6/NTAB) family NADH-FMN oxidoreductase RutF